MADKPTGSIIIKKVKKGDHGHHGGAWKVAFADFAVAMMAFFLVLWLTANTTPQEKQEISGFFLDPEKYKSILSVHGSIIDSGNDKKSSSGSGPNTGLKLKVVETPGTVEYQKEKMRLDSLKMQLDKKIQEDPNIRSIKDQVILDSTNEGLRIQIVDDAQGAMFESGSTELRDKAIQVLKSLAKTINQVPNKISITGHTDSKPFNIAGSNKTNWELSSERANAARRLLVENGLDEGKVARVVGVGSTALFDPKNPESATNRRISIIVLRKDAEAAEPKRKDNDEALENLNISKDFDLPRNLDPAEAKPEPAKVEPAKVEPAKIEPVKVAPVKAEPVKVEPVKVEPVKADPAKADPPKTDSMKGQDPAKSSDAPQKNPTPQFIDLPKIGLPKS